MKRAIFDALLSARQAKRPVAVVTELKGGAQALVDAADTEGDLALDAGQLAAVRRAIAEDRSGVLEGSGLFVHVHNPPLRLIIVGAVHIAQPLVPMARLAGYAVSVIDPRQAWATPERFPDVEIMGDWPDEAMTALQPDSRTAVVFLTHDPKLDDPALIVALRSEAFYIGALGSTRTHAKRLQRLEAEGFGAEDFARIHGPIGLPIGARSPAEIAVSILAQITQVRQRAPALVKREAAA